MKKQKQTYLSPETETLVVRFEVNIMSYGEKNEAGAGFGESGEYTYNY